MLNIPFKWEQQQSWQQRKIKKPGRRQEKEPCSLLVTWQDVFHASMNTLLKLQPISQATSKVIRPSRINVFATKLFTRNSQCFVLCLPTDVSTRIPNQHTTTYRTERIQYWPCHHFHKTWSI